MVHVSAEELSALLDGEVSPQAELRARQHLALCPSCSAEYALSVRLDDELRQPPVLACDEVLLVLSAALDREASEGEHTAAQLPTDMGKYIGIRSPLELSDSALEQTGELLIE